MRPRPVLHETETETETKKARKLSKFASYTSHSVAPAPSAMPMTFEALTVYTSTAISVVAWRSG